MKLKKINKKKKKSQLSAEFFIIASSALFFSALFLLAVQESLTKKTAEKREAEFKKLAYEIQQEIVIASRSTDGYNRVFSLPPEIGGKEYEVNLTSNFVYLRSKDGKNAISLPIPNVTGDLIIGENKIKKENGVVYVNP